MMKSLKIEDSITYKVYQVVSPIIHQKKFLDPHHSFFSGKSGPVVWDVTKEVLRWYDRYIAIISGYLQKPLKNKDNNLLLIMVIGWVQLTRAPTRHYYFVNETVGMMTVVGKSWFKGVANAVFRKLLVLPLYAHKMYIDNPVIRFSHPQWLLDQLRQDWPDCWEKIALANNLKPMVWATLLRDIDVDKTMSEHPYIKGAVQLPSIREWPEMLKDKMYIQDIAAQHLKLLLPNIKPQRVLDACSAPGGKAIIMHQKYPNAQMVCTDQSQARLNTLSENFNRLGLKGVRVLEYDWLNSKDSKESYDLILLDAPCSGGGVIKRHPEKKRHEIDFKRLAKQQLELFSKLWAQLKSGGFFIYSTCSLFKVENDGVVDQFLQSHDAKVLNLPCYKYQRKTVYGWQILPSYESDGHYFSVLKK